MTAPAADMLNGATIRGWTPEGPLALLVQGLFPCEVVEEPTTLVLRFLRLAPTAPAGISPNVIGAWSPEMEVRYSTAFELPRTRSVLGGATSAEEALDRVRAFVQAHARLSEVFPRLLKGLLFRHGLDPAERTAVEIQSTGQGLKLRVRDGSHILVPDPEIMAAHAYFTQVVGKTWVPYKTRRALDLGETLLTQHARLTLLADMPQLIEILRTEVLPVLCPT